MMKRRIRVFLFAAIAVVSCVCTTGCAKRSETTTTESVTEVNTEIKVTSEPKYNSVQEYLDTEEGTKFLNSSYKIDKVKETYKDVYSDIFFACEDSEVTLVFAYADESITKDLVSMTDEQNESLKEFLNGLSAFLYSTCKQVPEKVAIEYRNLGSEVLFSIEDVPSNTSVADKSQKIELSLVAEEGKTAIANATEAVAATQAQVQEEQNQAQTTTSQNQSSQGSSQQSQSSSGSSQSPQSSTVMYDKLGNPTTVCDEYGDPMPSNCVAYVGGADGGYGLDANGNKIGLGPSNYGQVVCDHLVPVSEGPCVYGAWYNSSDYDSTTGTFFGTDYQGTVVYHAGEMFEFLGEDGWVIFTGIDFPLTCSMKLEEAITEGHFVPQ